MADPLLLALIAAAALGAGAVAVVVHRAAPHRSTNRRLAMVLAYEGLLVACAGVVVAVGGPSQEQVAAGGRLAYAAFAAGFLGFAMVAFTLPWLYLAFLGTLPTGLARPLKGPRAEAAVLALVVAAPLAVGTVFVGEVAGLDMGPAWAVLGLAPLLLILVTLYGLAVAVATWRAAPAGTASRAQARAYALAFGARDGLWLLFLASLAVFAGGEGRVADTVFQVVPALTLLVYVPLLALGVLRTQLLDIDLKLKWTLKQSTVAAVFLAVFFVVSEMAQTFLADSGLGPYLGIAAAGVLVFALAPLQRAAERLSDAAMPRVEASPEYLAFRKLEVYKATLEGAYEDGTVTDAERAMLARLRAQLGIRPEDAATLEAEVASRAAGAAAATA